jgi:hypothetical protein
VFATTGALVLSEIYSIMGNISVILTGKETKEYDAVSMVIKFLMNKIEEMLEKLLK